MPLKDVNLRCRGCGKSISYAQAIFYANGTYCLDSILDLLQSSERGDDDVMRVNVSADLLSRLRDGVL